MRRILSVLALCAATSIGKPHYGDNLKMMGVGRYKLELSIAPPGGAQAGVGAGLEPFTVDYDFVFAGVGKKGAY